MPPGGWPRRDTPEAMLRALNAGADNLRKQELINKAHLREINTLQEELRTAKFKLWFTTGALLVLWEVFKALVLHS